MAKKKPKKSSTTLRFEPAVHTRLANVSDSLGMSVNGVVSYLVLRGLGRLELEAKVFHVSFGDQYEEMEAWVRAKPGRTRKRFVLAMIKRLMEESSRPSALPDVGD